MNHDGLKPYMDGTKTSAQAWEDGSKPLKAFMLEEHRRRASCSCSPTSPSATCRRTGPTSRSSRWSRRSCSASCKQAFIIGFIVFIPFLVIDIVVSGALMALGMMMMPPVMVSLPFKLLLFVLVDGWGLLIKSLVASYG